MELETHYSLRCLLNAQSGLRSTAAELAKLRRRLDKMLREKGMETARPVHDSIVRGTQLGKTVDFLYEAGAAEVHMRSACPPIMLSCKYLSFSRGKSDQDLIARRVVRELEGPEGDEHLDEYADSSTERGKCMLKRICEQLGFDSLGYQSLPGMLEAIGIDPAQVCTYCWDGRE